MVNSRRKGKTGELEAARYLREHLGLPASRSAQHSGKEQADLRGVPGVHFEVKRRRKIGACQFMEQAQADAATGEIPVVLLRPDDGHWLILLDPRDVERLAQRLSASRPV